MEDHNLLVEEISTALEWQDLVLNNTSKNQVKAIQHWLEHRSQITNDLHLKRLIKPGYRVLFHGPSGTGKTLTASLLGKTLGKSVHSINLTLMLSKYIGETEKNLNSIFNSAEKHDWILFFDEADAIFGKRTEVRHANDRYANLETAYFLQRLENYTGLVILAANYRSNIDEAFTRRFESVIHFPMPNRHERLKIWEQVFSGKFTNSQEVDLNKIAEDFELTGGAIISIVKRCVIASAVKKETVISLADLIKEIKKELKNKKI